MQLKWDWYTSWLFDPFFSENGKDDKGSYILGEDLDETLPLFDPTD